MRGKRPAPVIQSPRSLNNFSSPIQGNGFPIRSGDSEQMISRSRRIYTDGKHLFRNGKSFRVKGTTYGSFVPRLDGQCYPESSEIKKDLAEIAAAGLNVVRTYTLPPPELLDMARELGLYVLVGLDYRDWRYESTTGRAARRRVLDAGRREIARAMEMCEGRPEVLAISVGNEVPSDVVRAHGIRRVEESLSCLVEEVHQADPQMLATYCNFPTTEFLQIDGQDLVCFNVFLEESAAFRRYMSHLQSLSGDLPLVITELGLASNVHGEKGQAEALDWQLRIVDESGISGATVFAWTDDWGVDGKAVEGWEFGITDRERRPKVAFDVVRWWACSSIRDVRKHWPKVSVVICAYNAGNLLEKCLRSVAAIDYPDLEVIICDDGSTDATASIAQQFPFKILTLDHVGLSRARNAGIGESTGEIVAFLDADAFCHPEWAYHLALSLQSSDVAATGGPNLPVHDATITEQAVAQSPGAPMEVLVGPNRAEHVPGCNMAYRRESLLEVGGFNPIYTSAGDDVDVCWKILDRGWEIAFSPAAQVRHHRRDTARAYLKQQRGYGRAEALLAPHHPHRFNRLGQARWAGFVYGGPRFLARIFRPVVYHGVLGSAPYQSVTRRTSERVRDFGVALVPLLFLTVLLGAGLSVLSAWWLLLSALAFGGIAALAASVAVGTTVPQKEGSGLKLRLLVAFFHLAQPLVRTWGRLRTRTPVVVHKRTPWSGDRLQWLGDLEIDLADMGYRVRVGGEHAAWDLEVWRMSIVSWRVTTAVLWGWTPVAKLRPGLRIPGVVAVATGVSAFLVAPAWTWPLLPLVLLLGAREAFSVRKAIRKSVERTTRGSGA